MTIDSSACKAYVFLCEQREKKQLFCGRVSLHQSEAGMHAHLQFEYFHICQILTQWN